MMSSLSDLFTNSQSRIETVFNYYLKKTHHPAPILQETMAYAVFNGGKRIRPTLMYAVGETFSADLANLDAAAAAIELIHSYSLVHDDLPAMDNADLRRGMPSCHKAYNEALAILAGDALQALAFQIIATYKAGNLSDKQRLEMIRVLSESGGPDGIAAGQALDITLSNQEITAEQLTHLCQLKTGALLEASVTLGLIGSGIKDPSIISSLKTYASSLGLAFQLQDDLLDILSTSQTLGKPQGIDAINNKKTYPMLVGVEQTKNKIAELHHEVLKSIQFLGSDAFLLEELAIYLLNRKQ